MTQTIAVLGDIHGNARALRAALAQARSGAHDRIVFLGDLLTYGHDVAEVIDLVAEAQRVDGAALVLGNHDRMYFDIARGDTTYFDKLPEWLRQSVELTVANPATSGLARLNWSQEVVLDEVAIAGHANPFAFEDWRYLNGNEDHAAAAARLEERALSFGVFGHTHRPRWFDGTLHTPELDRPISSPRDRPIVVNAGAVGQPRDRSSRAVLLRLTLSDAVIASCFESVAYDLSAHIESLAQTGLPQTTVDRLASFFAAD